MSNSWSQHNTLVRTPSEKQNMKHHKGMAQFNDKFKSVDPLRPVEPNRHVGLKFKSIDPLCFIRPNRPKLRFIDPLRPVRPNRPIGPKFKFVDLLRLVRPNRSVNLNLGLLTHYVPLDQIGP